MLLLLVAVVVAELFGVSLTSNVKSVSGSREARERRLFLRERELLHATTSPTWYVSKQMQQQVMGLLMLSTSMALLGVPAILPVFASVVVSSFDMIA